MKASGLALTLLCSVFVVYCHAAHTAIMWCRHESLKGIDCRHVSASLFDTWSNNLVNIWSIYCIGAPVIWQTRSNKNLLSPHGQSDEGISAPQLLPTGIDHCKNVNGVLQFLNLIIVFIWVWHQQINTCMEVSQKDQNSLLHRWLRHNDGPNIQHCIGQRHCFMCWFVCFQHLIEKKNENQIKYVAYSSCKILALWWLIIRPSLQTETVAASSLFHDVQ